MGAAGAEPASLPALWAAREAVVAAGYRASGYRLGKSNQGRGSDDHD